MHPWKHDLLLIWLFIACGNITKFYIFKNVNVQFIYQNLKFIFRFPVNLIGFQ